MLRKLSFLLIFSVITSAVFIPASDAVDGVLSYDSSAESPLYLRAFDLPAGARVSGATLYINDSMAPPVAVYLLPSDSSGLPDWERTSKSSISPMVSDGDLLSVALSMTAAETPRKVWLAVEYDQGDDSPAEGRGGGPAMGYYARPCRLGDQLISADGGKSYDYLSSRLSLAMYITVDSSSSAQVGSLASMRASTETSRQPVGLHAAPNPFNPRTEVFFDLPVAGRVSLILYDSRGRRVRTLIDGDRSAGTQRVSWDGRDENGQRVASGTFFARLVASGITQSTRLVLIQ